MTNSSWLRSRGRRGSPRPRLGFRPRLEALDDRLVPSTLTVTNNLDTGVAGDGSLRGEIAAAKSGDAIVFDPILSGQSIDLYSNDNGGELVINKNLTIRGPSAPLLPVTINGFYSRVFEVDGAKTVVSLNNLNIMYGTGSAFNPGSAAQGGQGGEIWNGGILTVNACNLFYGSAVEGGAIYNAGNGALSVSNSTLDYNSAGQRPGFDPTYGGDGGAIYNIGTLTVSNSAMDNNDAYYGTYLAVGYCDYGGHGGGIFNAYKATATVSGSTLSGNYATYIGGGYTFAGGGMYNDGLMTLSGSTVSGNEGGIFNDKHGRLTITSHSSVVSNSVYDLDILGWVKISSDSVVG